MVKPCVNVSVCITKRIRILGMINRTIRYKERGIMVGLYKSLVRQHLEYCVIMLRLRSYLKEYSIDLCVCLKT